jgi:hypothetical protein
MKKSFSVDCLPSSSSPSSSLCSSRVSIDDNSDKASVDYLSDVLLGPVQARKKGVFWILLISPVFFFIIINNEEENISFNWFLYQFSR